MSATDFTYGPNTHVPACDHAEYGAFLLTPVSDRGRDVLAAMCGPMAVSFATNDLFVTVDALIARGCVVRTATRHAYLAGEVVA
jgi:hypothetical protein